MYIWRHDICHVTASRWCHICQNVSPIPSIRYDEAIFAVGIIKKVTGEKRQGGGTHPPGRPRVNVIPKTQRMSLASFPWQFSLTPTGLVKNTLLTPPPPLVLPLLSSIDAQTISVWPASPQKKLRDLLDLMLPRHLVRSRSNLTSPWFDEECCSVKRDVRRLERHYYHFSRDLSDRSAWITALRERTVNNQKSNSKKLWRTVSTVLGKSAGKSTSPPFSPAEFLLFLELKVETIRSATASAPPPIFTRFDSNLDSFDICRPGEISGIIKAPADKSCDLDPAPTFLVKECLDVLRPHHPRG